VPVLLASCASLSGEILFALAAAGALRWGMIRGLVVMLLLGGCAYSPPVRSLGYGAPGRLRQGELEVAGGFAAVPTPMAGGGWIGYGVRDWAAIEVGADGSIGSWGMGFAGGRFTHAPRRDHKLHGAVDGEIGVGLGAGGSQACRSDEKGCDSRRWNDRIALGGYVGGGAAYHFHFFAIYARARAQPTIAEGTPGTLWGQAHGGIQFRIARTLDIFSSAGVAGLVTRRDNGVFFAWDLGVAIHFDVTGKRRSNTARRGLRLRM